MRIDFHTSFDKQFKKLPKKHQEQFKKRLVLFAQDKTDPILNNHRLNGRYANYRSINVNGDIRAVFIEHTPGHVEFAYIGTHSQLYR